MVLAILIAVWLVAYGLFRRVRGFGEGSGA